MILEKTTAEYVHKAAGYVHKTAGDFLKPSI